MHLKQCADNNGIRTVLNNYIFQLELSLNAIHTPTNVLDKVGTRVRWVLHSWGEHLSQV